MDANRDKLLRWIESDQDQLVRLASRLIQSRSPNPPGNTLEVAGVIRDYLQEKQLSFKELTQVEDRPNIVSTFDGGTAGKSLVLNGHMDVLPVDESESWSYPPWSGEISDGKIWGRGATNMKCGLAIAVSTFAYLSRLRKFIKGSLTFSAVSDEIILGEAGTRYLMKEAPEIAGDACLLAEPSGLSTIRFAEKGPTRLGFQVRSESAHGAFTHKSEGAIRTAARVIAELDRLKSMPVRVPDERIARLLNLSRKETDEVQGAGAFDISQQVTVSITTIKGGISKNMIPSECFFVADIRLPIGVTVEALIGAVDEILAGYSNVRYEVLDSNPPAWCDPEGELVTLLQQNVQQLKGYTPRPIVSLGCTDARLWRYRGIPSYTYGPPPTGMGAVDEHVKIDDFIHVMCTHALTAYDYLTRE